MQKYRVETIYENNMKDFVLLCNVLLHGQTIHGLGPEDIVQRVMLQAWEKKEKLEYHENLIGWFVVACSKECKALYRRAYTEHRNVGHAVELNENIVATPVQDSLLRWLSLQIKSQAPNGTCCKEIWQKVGRKKVQHK